MAQENPPPYNPENTDQWAEQLVDYLIRRLANVERDIGDLYARIDALDSRVNDLENP